MPARDLRLHAAVRAGDTAIHFGATPHSDDHANVVAAAMTNRALCGSKPEPQWASVMTATRGHERNVIENTAMVYEDTACRDCLSAARRRYALPEVLDIEEIRFYAANEAVWGALSNLYRRPIVFEDKLHPSAEYAYQYGKPRDPAVRDWLMSAPSNALLAKAAHQLTRAWEVAPGWSGKRVERMRNVLRAKFTQHADLRRLLLCTGNARLVEAGTIDDDAGRFWGIVKGRGKNTLGVLLMEVREELRTGSPPPAGLAAALEEPPACRECGADLVACSHPHCDEATCPDSTCQGYGHQWPPVKHNDHRYRVPDRPAKQVST